MSKFNDIFSQNLKKYLDKENMNQAELAEKIGASRQSVSNWVTGKQVPRMEKLQKVADALNIDKNRLFESSESMLNIGNNNTNIDGIQNTVTNNNYYNHDNSKFNYQSENDKDYFIMIVNNIRYMDESQLKEVYKYTDYILNKLK